MFESLLIKTDVTAVKFINNYVFAGIGNFLFIFNQNGQLLDKTQIFDGHKIHGIVSIDDKILLFGGIFLQTLKYTDQVITKLNNASISDWILAAKWLKTSIAIIVMNNKFLLLNPDLSIDKEVSCNSKSILYSAFIVGDDNEDLLLLSGTVFGEILLWKVDGTVVKKLKGHNGVIFSVHYNNGFICTSSDDRSTILYNNDQMVCKVYGHKSRVFRSMVFDKYLVTAGEDSIVNVWDLHGNLINKAETRVGPIWALDHHHGDGVIISGGGSGGILKTTYSQPTKQTLTLPNNDVPKKVVFLCSGNIVAVSNNGVLYYYQQTKWLLVKDHAMTYFLLEAFQELVALTSHSDIYIYKDGSCLLAKTKHEPRILAFHWLNSKSFLICDDAKLSLFHLTTNDIVCVKSFDTKITSTCALQLEHARCIVGDRRGNLHLFNLGASLPFSLKKVHNHLGVTGLTAVNGNVISVGRDGQVKTLKVLADKLELISSHKTPFSWLCRFLNDSNILLAFSGDNFVVYDNLAKRLVFDHCCGGGHRSWDFLQTDSCNFCYVKDKYINVVKFSKKNRPTSVVPEFHTDSINCLKVVKRQGKFLVVSGGEDTNLRISLIGQDFYENVKCIKAHLSSIRTICVHELDTNVFLVFSGGGRGQIICWKLLINDEIECRQEFSFYEKKSDLFESEIRVMDLKIAQLGSDLHLFAALSDGKINIFQFNDNHLKLSKTISNKNKCVTKIHLFGSKLIAMTTDGCCNIFELLLEDRGVFTFRIHQSGVTGFDFHLFGDRVLFLTGGDDNCVVLSLLDSDLTFLNEFRDFSSHCAQVNGTWVGENFFLTSGTDQRLLVFKWICKKNKIFFEVVGRYNSSVADVHGIECCEEKDFLHVLLYGKGLEYVKIVKSELNKFLQS